MKARIIQIWAGRNIGHQKEQTGYYEWKNEIKNKNLATRIRTLEADGQLELQKILQNKGMHTIQFLEHSIVTVMRCMYL